MTIIDLPKAHGIPYLEGFYSLTLHFIFSKPPCDINDGNFQSYLLSKGNGKGILFLWSGVLFRSIPVSRSLGHQIGQCDLFLIFN